MLNLCLNGLDAMGPRGPDDPHPVEGTTAVLTVRDTGQGMLAEVRERLEPLHDQGPGRGTGLGLSMVYGIVKDHGGGIEIDSVVGQGTAVVVRLPRRRRSGSRCRRSSGSARCSRAVGSCWRMTMTSSDG